MLNFSKNIYVSVVKKIVFMFLIFLCIYYCSLQKVDASNGKFIELYTGETYNLFQDISGNYSSTSFSIDDDSIVSIDSQGIMTVLQPGETCVYLTYKDENNNTCSFFWEVTAYLSSGVYRIRNLASNTYLALADIKTKNDENVELQQYSYSGDSYLCQLWYIENLDGEYICSISPFSDNNAALIYSYDYNEIRVERIKPYIDYNYSGYNCWYIDSSIVMTGNQYYVDRKRLNEANIYGDNSNNNNTWVFDKVVIPPIGLKLIDEQYASASEIQTRYISINSKKSLQDLKIRVLDYGDSNNSLLWSSSNPNVVTVDAYTGEVTAVSEGNANIMCSKAVGDNNYSVSYSITVKSYADGVYSITNKLGYDALIPFQNGNNIYLRRGNGISSSTYWYLQCNIDGTYEISLANNNNFENSLLGKKDIDGVRYVTLQGYPNNSSEKATWTIEQCELGNVIKYKDEEQYSWTILDNIDSNLELVQPDYEEYESMWDINTVNGITTPTIYIHAYYDEAFLDLFEGGYSEMYNAMMEYLNLSKNSFEQELGASVYIVPPVELELSEERAQQLNSYNVENTGGKDDDTLYWEQLTEIVNYNKGTDTHYTDKHKYIFYTGHNHINSAGEYYSPVTGSINGICYIVCSDGYARCSFATIHELSHTLGARDHYHSNSGSCGVGDKCSVCGTYAYKRPDTCALNLDDYNPEQPFCNDCRMEMKSNLYFKCVQ